MSPNSDIKHVSSLFDAILHQNIFEITIKSSIFSGLLNSSSECFVTELSRLPGEPALSTLQAWLTTAHPRPGAAGVPQDSISVSLTHTDSFMQIQIRPFQDFNKMAVHTITGGEGRRLRQGTSPYKERQAHTLELGECLLR